jgi:hypothetical protein
MSFFFKSRATLTKEALNRLNPNARIAASKMIGKQEKMARLIRSVDDKTRERLIRRHDFISSNDPRTSIWTRLKSIEFLKPSPPSIETKNGVELKAKHDDDKQQLIVQFPSPMRRIYVGDKMRLISLSTKQQQQTNDNDDKPSQQQQQQQQQQLDVNISNNYFSLTVYWWVVRKTFETKLVGTAVDDNDNDDEKRIESIVNDALDLIDAIQAEQQVAQVIVDDRDKTLQQALFVPQDTPLPTELPLDFVFSRRSWKGTHDIEIKTSNKPT